MCGECYRGQQTDDEVAVDEGIQLLAGVIEVRGAYCAVTRATISQDLGAVLVEFDWAHALDAAQRSERGGALGGDGREHRVVSDDVGGHVVLPRALAAPLLERGEQRRARRGG